MSESLLEMKGVTKVYEGTVAVSSFDFSMSKGEIRCLAGMNGSGKSTVVKCISGVEPIDEGEIFICGKRQSKVSHVLKSMQEGLHVIHQDFALLPSLTVGENIMFPHFMLQKQYFINKKKIEKLAEKYIQDFDETIAPQTPVEELSVAQKQIVAIIRALSLNVKLLVMDEPTSALTNQEIERLLKKVKQVSETGVGVIFITHKYMEIKAICDSITVIRNGIKIGDYLSTELTEEELSFHMAGRKIELSKKSVKDTDEVAMSVENFTSALNHFHDINFDLHKGEVLGIGGKLGAGRTEFLLSLWGLNKRSSGTLKLFGKEVHINNPTQAVSNGIGFIPEDRRAQALCMELSIIDNLNLEQFILKSKYITRQDKRVNEIVQLLSIKFSDLFQPVSELSGGNQQKVTIAKWLVVNPSIVLLDNPTMGIDIGSRIDIYNLIQKLKNDGVSFVLVSDEVEELKNLCDRMLILKDKTINSEIDPSEYQINQIYNML